MSEETPLTDGRNRQENMEDTGRPHAPSFEGESVLKEKLRVLKKEYLKLREKHEKLESVEEERDALHRQLDMLVNSDEKAEQMHKALLELDILRKDRVRFAHQFLEMQEKEKMWKERALKAEDEVKNSGIADAHLLRRESDSVRVMLRDLAKDARGLCRTVLDQKDVSVASFASVMGAEPGLQDFHGFEMECACFLYNPDQPRTIVVGSLLLTGDRNARGDYRLPYLCFVPARNSSIRASTPKTERDQTEPFVIPLETVQSISHSDLISDGQTRPSDIPAEGIYITVQDGDIFRFGGFGNGMRDTIFSKVNHQLLRIGGHVDHEEVVERYENQRYDFIKKTWAESWLPTDRYAWSDLTGRKNMSDKAMEEQSGRWMWLEPRWTVALADSSDTQGWSYALDFPFPFHKNVAFFHNVRRRKWTRTRLLKARPPTSDADAR